MSRSIFYMKKDILDKLQKTIHVKFKNADLLKQAFVHRSYLNEHPDFELAHNERLEFLGDAVLELVVTEHLYQNYDNPEGELTNWRASLVNAKMLAEIARLTELEDCLFLSKGEAKDSGSKARQYIMANAVEALIGAIHLDQGYKAAEHFIHEFIIVRLPHILKYKLYLDPKSRFQEEAQARVNTTPTYKVHRETGPDHKKHFVIGVYLDDKLVCEGEGTSKQEAQTDAAEKAIEEMNWE